MPRGVDRLYINLEYALTTGDGEFHPPKMPNRVERLLEPALVQSARETVLTDALAMHRRGVALSPAWLRQLGYHAEAAATETNLQQLQQILPAKQKGKRRSKVVTWDADAILDERGRGKNAEVLVRWEGYDPRWEVGWTRATGQPGEPMTTWEPRSSMANTQAMLDWLEVGARRVAESNHRLPPLAPPPPPS
eukprot:7380359-Prymnesium_polylepis.1